jgi:hypothetical protein
MYRAVTRAARGDLLGLEEPRVRRRQLRLQALAVLRGAVGTLSCPRPNVGVPAGRQPGGAGTWPELCAAVSAAASSAAAASLAACALAADCSEKSSDRESNSEQFWSVRSQASRDAADSAARMYLPQAPLISPLL